MSDQSEKIYVDIQSLLEMRQSTLASFMGTKEALDYIHTEEYYLRDTDTFPVDQEAYDKLISTPSKEAMRLATITYLIVVLAGRISQMEKLNVFNDKDDRSELLVNTYPYMFNEGEKARFKNAVFVKLGVPVLITLLYEPIETFTPSFIKHSGISQFYCYDGSAWLAKHTEQIGSGALKSVRLYFPTLGKIKLTKEDVKKLTQTGFKDIFAYTEFIFAPHVKIQFLPAVFYSNLVTATAVLETFNEGIKTMDLSSSLEKES